jgi:hypothetical protein
MGRRRRAGSRWTAEQSVPESAATSAAAAVDTVAAPLEQAAATALDAVGRAAEGTGRAARKAGAATERAGRKARRRAEMTPARARRLVGVGRAVLPLLAPYALAAAGIARARYEAYRAARLGVAPGELHAYSGRGAALHARIDRIAQALDDIDDGTPAHAPGSGRRFVTATRPRLVDLAVAVRATEQMPTARRRTAHRAIGAELDRIEVALLEHLGVSA